MFEYIVGKVTDLSPAYAVIETGGIGYYVNITVLSYSQLKVGENTKFYLHHVVREDAQTFY